jgi:protoporphyrinogen oxidase
VKNGFSFDEGAHVFFGTDDISRTFIREPLGPELIPHVAEIWNDYGNGRFGRYPVQANAHALPPEIATACVKDFIEAERAPAREIRTYAEWCLASFGVSFAERFMFRYARKVWTVEPEELTTEWLGSSVGNRITRPPLEDVLRGAIDPNPRALNYLTEFVYPTTGGFGRIADRLAEGVTGVHVGNGVAAIRAADRRVTFSDGSTREYEAAISTIPLPSLIRRVEDAPPEVRQAAERLLWTSVRCVNIGVDRSDVGPGHWVYFYDPEVPFFRISFPSKFAPGNAPPGTGSISCEIAYSRRRPLDDSNLGQRVVDALRRAGILRDGDRVVFEDQVDIPYAYVVFDFARKEALRVIHGWMDEVSLFPCGRFGEWGYHWSFDAIASGRRVAARVAESRGFAGPALSR